MAAFQAFEYFTHDLCAGVHHLNGNDDTLKVMLSNTAPSVSTDRVKSHISEIAEQNGYVTGGIDVQNGGAWIGGGLFRVSGVDVQFTASGGPIGPFRYVVLYNDTPTNPLKPLIGMWDRGSSLTLADGQTFTVDFGAFIFYVIPA